MGRVIAVSGLPNTGKTAVVRELGIKLIHGGYSVTVMPSIYNRMQHLVGDEQLTAVAELEALRVLEINYLKHRVDFVIVDETYFDIAVKLQLRALPDNHGLDRISRDLYDQVIFFNVPIQSKCPDIVRRLKELESVAYTNAMSYSFSQAKTLHVMRNAIEDGESAHRVAEVLCHEEEYACIAE